MVSSGLPNVSGGHGAPVSAPLGVRVVPWPAGTKHSWLESARGPAVVIVPPAPSHGVHGSLLYPVFHCEHGDVRVCVVRQACRWRCCRV